MKAESSAYGKMSAFLSDQYKKPVTKSIVDSAAVGGFAATLRFVPDMLNVITSRVASITPAIISGTLAKVPGYVPTIVTDNFVVTNLKSMVNNIPLARSFNYAPIQLAVGVAAADLATKVVSSTANTYVFVSGKVTIKDDKNADIVVDGIKFFGTDYSVSNQSIVGQTLNHKITQTLAKGSVLAVTVLGLNRLAGGDLRLGAGLAVVACAIKLAVCVGTYLYSQVSEKVAPLFTEAAATAKQRELFEAQRTLNQQTTADLDTANKKIEQLEAQKKLDEKSIVDLKGELSTAKESIDDLNGELDVAKNQIKTLRGELDVANQKVSDLEKAANIKAAEENLARLRKEMQDLPEDALQEAKDALQEQITKAEQIETELKK